MGNAFEGVIPQSKLGEGGGLGGCDFGFSFKASGISGSGPADAPVGRGRSCSVNKQRRDIFIPLISIIKGILTFNLFNGLIKDMRYQQ